MINGHTQQYVTSAINGEVARLASARVGERNNVLFKAAAALASLDLREREIIQHLKPAAHQIGIHGKEFYSTLKSGVKTGHSNLRTASGLQHSATPIASSKSTLPARSKPENGMHVTFFPGGDEGPRISHDEIRRHIYRREDRVMRIKIKRNGGFVNWYRVQDGSTQGWQAKRPDGYVDCPYVGPLDPFDPEIRDDDVYWPEGEKDCDTLGNNGVPAFTFGGAGDGLPPTAIEFVRGRNVIILADNDKAGREHAVRKAAAANGVAASLKIVEFVELPNGGDVSDFLSSNSIDQFQLRVERTPIWIPSAPQETANNNEGRSLLTCSLADVLPEKVEWIWPGRVAVGKLTMIAGEPGLGKSQLCIAIASTVTRGSRWPDDSGTAPLGSVIILSAEDGLADTIRPRFDAAGGDPSKVTVIRAVQRREGSSTGRQSFDLAADIKLLEDEIRRRGDVRLVEIDPISSYMGRVDSHKNADVRGVLEPLGEMAERMGVGIVGVTHLSKGDGKAINRFIGSIAFVAAARTAFAVVTDPEDDAGLRRLFLQVKNNIAGPQPGLAFRLEQHEVAPGVIGSAIAWDDTAGVSITVDQALRAGSTESGETAKDDALEFLREILAQGPVDVIDIEAEARASAMLGETRRLKESKPFRSAAKELAVVRRRQGFGPGARIQWSLPEHKSLGPTAGDLE